MSLTEYKYRKLRDVVARSGASNGVKQIALCALRQYKKGVEPINGEWFDGNKRACLVGAALFDKASRLNVNKSLRKRVEMLSQTEAEPKSDPDLYYLDDYEGIASFQFGVKRDTVCSLVAAFDEGVDRSWLSKEPSKAARLGAALARGLFGDDVHGDDDEDF